VTDDELHRMWIEGYSKGRIAIRAGTTIHTIAGRIRRLRRREGLDRWPKRLFVADKPAKPGDKPRSPERAGKTTLPPLRSLDT
jgi:hypothetical protein